MTAFVSRQIIRQSLHRPKAASEVAAFPQA
jgi:hypothetical protein